jgi:FAD/FMN-containing dehydrogenase
VNDHSAIAADLRDRLTGRVIGSDDPEFPTASQGWSRAVQQRPLAVVEVADAADVVATVRYARARGLPVSAQATGHGATSTVDGTLLVRTTGLGEFTVDGDAGQARVGAGVAWGAALRDLNGTGRIGLAGSNPSPSVVGYLLGGGLSWFGRRYGNAAHHVYSLDVVSADGELTTVTAETDPELFWALRGGGGDLAIVTAAVIALPAEPEVVGGRLMWPIDRAGEVVAAYRQITQAAPRELTAWLQLLSFPDLPMLPPPLRGQRFVAVDAAYLGAADTARELLAPALAVDGRVQDSVGPLAIGDLGTITAEPTEPSASVTFSLSLERFDEALSEALLAAAAPEVVGIQIRHLGGAFADAVPGGGVAGVVAEPYFCSAVALAVSPEVKAAGLAGFARLNAALAPAAAPRVPFNGLGGDDPTSRAFAAEDLDRLRRLKGERDPDNLIRSNRPLLG